MTLKENFLDPLPDPIPSYLLNQPPAILQQWQQREDYRSTATLTWSSWSYFAYLEMDTPTIRWADVTNLVIDKIDHAGSVFGLPANPKGFPDFPEGVIMPRTSGGYKGLIAERILRECLARVQMEAQERIREIVRKEGLNGLKAILEGEPIFEKLLDEEER